MVKISKIPGLGDYGVFVDGLDLENISLDEWKSVYGKLHLKTLVTIFRNTKIDPVRFHSLTSAFGRSNAMSPYSFLKKYKQKFDPNLPIEIARQQMWAKFTSGEIPVDVDDQYWIRDMTLVTIPGIPPQVHRVSGKRNDKGERIGIFADGELAWHCNESGHLCFTPGVALMPIQYVEGTSTDFCISAPWYERQSESLRSELDQLICVHQHIPGRTAPGADVREDNTTKYNFCPVTNYIPLVIRSPGGIKGLHFSYSTVTGFKDMKKTDSDKLLHKINSEMLMDSNVYAHQYLNNRQDILFFENSITQHRRIGDVKDRILYRCTTSYCDLLDYQYQPYFQEEYKQKLQNLLTDVSDVIRITFPPFDPND